MVISEALEGFTHLVHSEFSTFGYTQTYYGTDLMACSLFFFFGINFTSLRRLEEGCLFNDEPLDVLFFPRSACVLMPPSLPTIQSCAFCSTHFLAVPLAKQSSYTSQLPEVCCSDASIPDLLLRLWAIAVRCLPTLLFQMLLFHHPVSHNFHRGSPTTLLLTTIWSCTKAKASKIPLALAP